MSSPAATLQFLWCLVRCSCASPTPSPTTSAPPASSSNCMSPTIDPPGHHFSYKDVCVDLSRHSERVCANCSRSLSRNGLVRQPKCLRLNLLHCHLVAWWIEILRSSYNKHKLSRGWQRTFLRLSPSAWSPQLADKLRLVE